MMRAPGRERRLDAVDPVAVCFDAMGRAGAFSRAPQVLRANGLEDAFPAATTSTEVVVGSAANGERGRLGFINEAALLDMIAQVRTAVGASLENRRFPLLYGADCSVLLGALPGLARSVQMPGLICLDGHEDATLMASSLDGEAANMEIALLVGFDEPAATTEIVGAPSVVRPEHVALLGPRDGELRQRAGIPSVADRVWLRSAESVVADPIGHARQALSRVTSQCDGWWLHIDLDVLSHSEYSACGDPSTVPAPGGLTWDMLTSILSYLTESATCRGWSISVYNPDLDADHQAARRIVKMVREVARSW